MASSSSSSFSRHRLCKILVCTFLVVVILFPSPSSAVRSIPEAAMDRVFEEQGHVVELHRRDHYTGFRYRGRVFNFLPKGTPVTPSGPSKRHNAVVNSSPRN